MVPESDGVTLDGGRTRPRVCGLVTCFNEEHNIGDCIESLLWCDDIVVVDSFSTDRTPEIARGYDKVRFFQRTYYGAGARLKVSSNLSLIGDWSRFELYDVDTDVISIGLQYRLGN